MAKSQRAVAVIDCETDPFGITDTNGNPLVPKPFVWGFFDGQRFRDFATAAALVDFLRPQRLVVYAHNGGRFDYHYMLDLLEPYSDVMVVNGRLSRFMIGECEFRDSYNILPIPLAQYKKEEIDYAKMMPDVRHKHMPEIMQYLRADCVYLYELVAKFRAEYGTGLTLAGSAMKYWKTLTGENSPESSGDFYASLSPYYYGGRVQCFARGVVEKPFAVVDINSAYPFAMLREHPFSSTFVERDVSRNFSISETSFYTIEAISRGAFPFRDGGKLIFPSDDKRRTYHITGWELEAALATETAEITSRVVRRIDFGKTINFKQYIEHFYNLKRAAPKESAEYLFAKLMMNSLYGKFGANPDNYSNFGIVPTRVVNHFTDPTLAEKALDENEHALDVGKHRPPWNPGTDTEPSGFYWQSAGLLGPWALVQGDLAEPEKRYYNLATAASITGFVRSYLWRHIVFARSLRGDPLYCDTDSIAFANPEKAFEAFPISNRLGDWTHEGDFSRGAIAGKKLYAFQYTTPKKDKRGNVVTHKIASKGVRLSADEIFRVAGGAAVTASSEIPTFSVHKPPTFTKRRIRATASD